MTIRFFICYVVLQLYSDSFIFDLSRTGVAEFNSLMSIVQKHCLGHFNLLVP